MEFRGMRRFKQQLSDAECEKILIEGRRGVLSVHGENGYPYGVPMNFLYEDGKIYFHGAREGHKIDAVRNDCKVCFTVIGPDSPHPGKLGPDVASVIAFGRIRILEDPREILARAGDLGRKYDPEDYVAEELERNEGRVQVLELAIDHMTGKRVNES